MSQHDTTTPDPYEVRPLRFLSVEDVESRTSLTRRTIYRWIKDGTFPVPVRLSAGRVAWVESEIVKWQEDLVDERN